jgi:hypothetical protein
MGKQNNYLTLEESGRVLGKPASWIKDIIARGDLGAKLSGGRWLISVRDLDTLRVNLPPEQKNTVHTFLTNSTSSKPRSLPKTQPITNVGEPFATRSGASVQEVAHKKAPARKQVGNKKARKKPKKAKVKRSERDRLARVGELEKGQRLYRQITAVERKIRVEISKCERAKEQGKVCDSRALQLLVWDFEDLKKRYAGVRDPLGLLPSLVPTSSKVTVKKSTRKRKGAPAPQTHRVHEQDSSSKSVQTKLQKTQSSDSVQKGSKKKRTPKRKFSNIVSINSTVPKSEVMNTFDPRRTLEVWEKPQVASKGKYQQPGEQV